MAAKIFEVGDVLPAGLIAIYGEVEEEEVVRITFNNNYIQLDYISSYSLNTDFTYSNKSDNFMIIDLSLVSLSDREVVSVSGGDWGFIEWEEVISGYSITFEENGGTSVTDLTEQTSLPSTLPTPTKANHVFAGWYYDNLFTQKATAGDELTANVTLYAKWYTPTTWCEDIADAIREKEGSSGNIKHVDFPDRIEALPSPKAEETKSVSPNFASGNVVVTPTTNKVMTQVTVNKDTTNHKAENIKKDITLYGVTGTFEGSGADCGYILTLDVGGARGGNIDADIKCADGNIIRVYVDKSYLNICNCEYVKVTSHNGGCVSGVDVEGATYQQVRAGHTLTEDVYICSWEEPCLMKGTAITLSDGSMKNIENITYDDELLVWNFDNGEFTKAKPIIIIAGVASRYKHVLLENGYELKTIQNHRLFNVDQGKFMYPKNMIGETTVTQDGKLVKVLSVTKHDEQVEYYNITTDYHINLYANKLLTSNRLNNIYPIQDMKFIKDARPINNINEFCDIPKKYIDGLRLLEQPQDINKDGASVRGKTPREYALRQLFMAVKE